MHMVRLGKGKGLAGKASHLLPEGAVPTLHMAGLTRFFAYTTGGLLGEDFGIGISEVTEGVATFGGNVCRSEGVKNFVYRFYR